MNLDKLKELGAKATPGILESIPSGYLEITKPDGETISTKEDIEFEYLFELRNSAKEMIETIERYKAVMETVVNNPDYTNPEKMVRALKEALKDPEKTGAQKS